MAEFRLEHLDEVTDGGADHASRSPDENLTAATAALGRAEAARPLDEEAVAEALWTRGRAFAALERTEEALADFDSIVERFAASRSVAVRVLVGKASRGRAGRLLNLDPKAAERAARQSVELLERLADEYEQAVEPLAESLRVLAIVQSRQGDHETALELTDRIDGLVSSHPAVEGLALAHARMLSMRALLLSRLGRHEEATEVREGLLDRYGNETDPKFADHVTAAEFILAERADEQGDRDEGYQRMKRLVDRYRDRPAQDWPKPAEAALAQLGAMLWRDDRDAEAVAVFDRWLELFASDQSPKRRARELRVRLRRARALAATDEKAEALRELDRLVAAGEDEVDEAPAIVTRAVVARVALVHELRGARAARRALDQAKRRLSSHPVPDEPGLHVELLQEELSLLREAKRLRALRDAARAYIERFSLSDDLMLQRGLGYAWQFRARVAWDLGDPDGETTALEAMVAHLGRSTDPVVLDRVDQSRARLVRTLAFAGRQDALLAQVAALVARFEASQTDEELIERGSRAIRGLGALLEARRLREVQPLAERVFARAEPAGEVVGDIAIRALHAVAACQEETEDRQVFEQTYERLFEFGEHSVALYRELSDAFAAMDTEFGRYQHAFHLFGLAKALEAVGRDQECLDVIDEAFRLYEDNLEDRMPEMMAAAAEDRDELRKRLGRDPRSSDR